MQDWFPVLPADPRVLVALVVGFGILLLLVRLFPDFFARQYWIEVQQSAWNATWEWLYSHLREDFLVTGIPFVVGGVLQLVLRGQFDWVVVVTAIGAALGCWLLTGLVLLVYHLNMVPRRLRDETVHANETALRNAAIKTAALQDELRALRQRGIPRLRAIEGRCGSIVVYPLKPLPITASGTDSTRLLGDASGERAAIAQLVIKNDPEVSRDAYARNVGAEITFYSGNEDKMHIDTGRWADKGSPTFPDDQSQVGQVYFDVGTTHALDIAIKGDGDADCFAFDNQSLQGNWRRPSHRLPYGDYLVTVRLRSSDGVDEVFVGLLTNAVDRFSFLLADGARS